MRMSIRNRANSSGLALAAIFTKEEVAEILPRPGYDGDINLALTGDAESGLVMSVAATAGMPVTGRGGAGYRLTAHVVPGHEEDGRRIVIFPISPEHRLAGDVVRALDVVAEIVPGTAVVRNVPEALRGNPREEALMAEISSSSSAAGNGAAARALAVAPALAPALNLKQLSDIMKYAQALSDAIVASGLPITVSQAEDRTLTLDLSVSFPQKKQQAQA